MKYGPRSDYVITPIYGELFYYFSHSIQHIAHLSWEWDQNWDLELLVVCWDRADVCVGSILTIMRAVLSQVRICRLPPLSFALIFIKDSQCTKSNEKSILWSLFFEISWKFIENWLFSSIKMTITQKKKKSEIFMIVLHIQPILHLSCKFDHFWIKKFDFDVCMTLKKLLWNMLLTLT